MYFHAQNKANQFNLSIVYHDIFWCTEACFWTVQC